MRRTLLAETKSLLESPHRPVSFWENSTKHKIATLISISETADPAAIPDIVFLLLDRNRDVASCAARAVSALTRSLKPAEFPWLDQLMRERSPYRWAYSSSWVELQPRQLDHFQTLGADSVFALGMASFHSSGHVREEALLRLSDLQDGTELPFLLMRLNDWVSEVRETAHRLVQQRLTTGYARFFAIHIALVNRLEVVRRGNQQTVLEAIKRLMESEEGRKAVEIQLRSPERQTRRACYDLAFASTTFDQAKLLEWALSDVDPAIRLLGSQRISFLSDKNMMDGFLRHAREDRFAAVRRTALRIHSERFPEQARSWLERSLMDSHPAVGGVCCYSLLHNQGHTHRCKRLAAFQAMFL